MGKSRQYLAAFGLLVLFAPLFVPYAIIKWEWYRLSESHRRASVEALFGSPREVFEQGSLKDHFHDWDFHDVATGAVTFTPDLPSIKDGACRYRGCLGVLTEYIVYFDGNRVTHAYFIGYN